MNIDFESPLLPTTSPVFINEAEQIQSHLKQKSPQFLSELMEISESLANENWERNQNWKTQPNEQESAQAIFAFTGEVYKGLNAKTLEIKALQYLQNNYRILSGLYGLLKPSDRIMPYRLEMGRNFEFETHPNLYDFWRDIITTELNSQLQSGEILLNLASKEYFKSINKKALHAKIIDVDFYEMKSGKPKTIVVYTKHARGLMVRFCAQTHAQTLNDVKAFNYEGYLIDEEQSSDTRLVFKR